MTEGSLEIIISGEWILCVLSFHGGHPDRFTGCQDWGAEREKDWAKAKAFKTPEKELLHCLPDILPLPLSLSTVGEGKNLIFECSRGMMFMSLSNVL